jgi:DNA polymerase sigma
MHAHALRWRLARQMQPSPRPHTSVTLATTTSYPGHPSHPPNLVSGHPSAHPGQVKAFGSYATGLMRPGSDIDLVVTLPRVRTTTAIPEAPGELEGRNAIPKDTWQANLARCLLDQPWVIAESVRTIQSLVPIVSFATRFTVAGGRPLRLDVSFEGAHHLGLSTNALVMRALAERPATKPLTLVVKQLLAERSLDKPYLGGLSSHGLFLLVTRFLQAQHTHSSHRDGGGGSGGGGRGAPEAMDDLGALLVSLLDFYAHRFDPRIVGVAVARNAGEGECVLDT